MQGNKALCAGDAGSTEKDGAILLSLQARVKSSARSNASCVAFALARVAFRCQDDLFDGAHGFSGQECGGQASRHATATPPSTSAPLSELCVELRTLKEPEPAAAPTGRAGRSTSLRQRLPRGSGVPSSFPTEDCGVETRDYTQKELQSRGEVHSRKGIEALEYAPADSATYRGWLRAHPEGRRRAVDRWALMFVLGCVVGLIAFTLHFCIDSLSKAKAREPRRPSIPRISCTVNHH